MRGPARWAAGLAILGAIAGGCHEGASEAPPADAALEARFAGCDAVAEGPVCELGESRLVRVFVPGAQAEDVTFARAVATGAPRDVPEGLLYSVRVDGGASAIDVLARAGDAGGARARFTLRVAEARPMPWLKDANALREKGALDAAEARAAEAGPGDAEQAAAEGLRGRIALRRGAVDDAVLHLRRAIALDRAAGRSSNRAHDTFALAFVLDDRAHRFAEARAALDELAPDLAAFPEGAAHAPFYRGQLAVLSGDPRGGLRLLEEARAAGERLGLGPLTRTARHMIAQQLVFLGRDEEALAQVRALEKELASATDAAPCEAVEMAITAGYASLQLGRNDGEDDARAIASNGACADRYLRAIALGHLAFAESRRGEIAAARARLVDARATVAEPRLCERLLWIDIDARLALAEGHAAQARAAYEREAAIAEGAQAYAEAWRAAVGRGEALEALGDREGAVRAYDEAEGWLDRHALAIPLGEGRGSFVGDADRSARALVDLLVRLGRPAPALDAARRARARVLSSVARGLRVSALGEGARARWEEAVGAYRREREALDAAAADDWKLARSALVAARAARATRGASVRASLDEAMALLASVAGDARADAGGPLAAPLPRDGEVVLAFHPDRDAGWIGFAAEGRRVTAFRSGPIAPDASRDALAAQLLAPVDAILARARRVRVLPYGPLRAVDIHALPWRGAPLVASVPVEYGLDVAAAHAPARARVALVVADPTEDLPRTRAEAAAVGGRLAAAGWSVARLQGREATSARVRDELPRAGLFHYAGHGLFSGRDGEESALPLALGGALTLPDVLALPAVPARVVLSGCDAARGAQGGGVEGLGLAQVFVLAGADFVIAPAHAVDDASAATFSAALAADLAAEERGGNADGAAVLRAAQNRLREAGDGHWADFRAVVP